MIASTTAVTAPVYVGPRRPGGRVTMRPAWRHLLFLHWPVSAGELQAKLPPGLEVDTFDGQAYIGLVPFTMSGVCPRGLPSWRWITDFHEINVRTYVKRAGAANEAPGVWFFSLDAASRPAVLAARAWYKLPYFFAHMSLARRGHEVVYSSHRMWPAPLPAACEVRYRTADAAIVSQPGTLEHFLVERYILYSYADGRLLSGRVHHKPYRLQPAQVVSLHENLIAAAGISRPDIAPLSHYAKDVRTEIFAPQTVL